MRICAALMGAGIGREQTNNSIPSGVGDSSGKRGRNLKFKGLYTTFLRNVAIWLSNCGWSCSNFKFPTARESDYHEKCVISEALTFPICQAKKNIFFLIFFPLDNNYSNPKRFKGLTFVAQTKLAVTSLAISFIKFFVSWMTESTFPNVAVLPTVGLFTITCKKNELQRSKNREIEEFLESARCNLAPF